MLYDLELPTISSIIQRSLSFIKGDEELGQSDLDLILMFASDAFADRDQFQLLLSITYKYRKCLAFDFQTVKKMREFLLGIDPL